MNHEQSPLIKQILLIHDILIERKGSIDAAIGCLQSWFCGRERISLAYDFLMGKVGRWPWKSIIWKSSIIPKHRIALWMFSHGNFLTRDRLGDLSDKKCVFCNDMNETFNHLFFEFPTTNDEWKTTRKWLGMRNIMSTSRAVLKAYKSSYRGNSILEKMRCAALAACIYHV